jgi:hypothetical protein
MGIWTPQKYFFFLHLLGNGTKRIAGSALMLVNFYKPAGKIRICFWALVFNVSLRVHNNELS